MADIDKQLAKAEERVKRLKQKKVLKDAKDAIAENKALKEEVKKLQSVQRELTQKQDSIEWTRSAIQNLIKDIKAHKFGSWTGEIPVKNEKVTKTLSRDDLIVRRLNGILNGQQPQKK